MVTHSTDSIFSAGLILQGRYRLDEPVATGGMAEVWKGHDLVLQRQVAIKLLHPHLASDPAVSERFRREAISAARLSHPHIVPTFDTGTDRGVSYIVLGLVSGPTLADAIKEGPLSTAETITIARQVADALEHAHQNGLVHRDIKPSNILIVDNGGRVMVADFGIAKAIAETATDALTLPGLVVGTPGYVAPEQLNGSTFDPRADIFSLGVMIHEMVCGHTDAAVATQIAQPQDLDAGNPHACPRLPEILQTIVSKATAPDADDRYQTAGDMRDALIDAEIQLHGHAAEPIHDEPQEQPKPSISANGEFKIPVELSAAPLSRTTKKRPFIAIIVVLILITAAIALGLGIRTLGRSTATETTAKPNNSVAMIGANSFDPKGDKVENELQAVNVIDSNPTTTWSTETYSTSEFGNLKQGVGLVVHVAGASKLGQLQIDSPSSGWGTTIFVGSGDPTTVPGWGTQVAAKSDIQPGTSTFDLQQTSGNSVLIWITDLGSANRVSINDVRISTNTPAPPTS